MTQVTANDTTQIFIINVSLIEPINKILKGLEDNTYRDCDIKWLNFKMEAFIEFAAKTLGVSIKMPPRDPRDGFTTLNSHVLNYFNERFTTLLKYFRSFL